MLLLPGGVLRASVWDGESRETVMRDVTADLPFFLRTTVRLHDEVTLKDLLLLAEAHLRIARASLFGAVSAPTPASPAATSPATTTVAAPFIIFAFNVFLISCVLL